MVIGALGSTSKKLKNCIEELHVRFVEVVRWREGEKSWGKGRGRERVPKTEQVRNNVKV